MFILTPMPLHQTPFPNILKSVSLFFSSLSSPFPYGTTPLSSIVYQPHTLRHYNVDHPPSFT